MERLEHWKERLDKLQRTHGVSWWQLSYGHSILKKAEDFIAVEQNEIVDQILERLEIWFEKLKLNTEKDLLARNEVSYFDNVIKQKLIQDLTDIRKTINHYKRLIPRMEKMVYDDSFQRFDKELCEENSKHLDQADLELLRGDMLTLRARVIQRVRRSMRAQGSLPNLNAQLGLTPADGESNVTYAVGPYNNLHNLSETLSAVRERDPIWVEDLLQCYHHLLQFSDKLNMSPAKKKGSRKK